MDSPSCLAVAACRAAVTRSAFSVGRVFLFSVFFLKTQCGFARHQAEARAESQLAVPKVDVVSLPGGIDARRQNMTFV